MRRSFVSPSLLVLGLMVPTAALASPEGVYETDLHGVRVEVVASGLEHPWGLAFLPDGRYLVTERNPGTLRLGHADGSLSEPLEGVPEIFRYKGETGRSQAGMFDVALHPDFAENQMVYLSLSPLTERGTGTSVVRGRLVEEGGQPRLENVETIFEMQPEDQDSSGLHFGGALAINPDDNSVFVSIGERRNISRSQDPEDQAGSIIRVAEDGSVPDDNPFVDDDEVNDKIYSWGHRNPQGLAFNPETGTLWAVDHGPLGGDEVERVEPGNNYGWPYLTSGVDYSGAPIGVGTQREGMTSAVHHFEDTVAPSGLAFYTGDMFPQWRGHMLIGGLAGQSVVRLRLDGTEVAEEEWMLGDMERRIRQVKVASDGAVWLLTEHADGEVLRLTPADAVAEQPRD